MKKLLSGLLFLGFGVGCSNVPTARKKVNCLIPSLSSLGASGKAQKILGGESMVNKANDPRVKSTVFVKGCTGVIVAEKLVLTAAHCVDIIKDMEVTFDLDMADANKGKVYKPVSTKRHPKFSSMEYDIAYMVLGEPIPNGYAPIPIWTDSSKLEPKKTMVTLMGYGKTSVTSEKSKHLRGVDIVFKGMAKGYLGLILLGPAPKKGSCNGDSGGPGFVTDADGNHFLFGVTSGFYPQFFPEVNAADGCNTGAVVYTEVHAHRKWIEENSKIKLSTTPQKSPPSADKNPPKPGKPPSDEPPVDSGDGKQDTTGSSSGTDGDCLIPSF